MDLKEKAVLAVDALEKEYPDAQCSLVYDPEKAYELLISTRLSAQCTDARVNIVTKDLFQKYTSLQDFANAPIEEMEEMIKTCGLFKTKGVGQKILAAAMDATVSVMKTAGEGGAWGIALLASYMVNKDAGEALEDYLQNKVFGGDEGEKMDPDPEDVKGFIENRAANYKLSGLWKVYGDEKKAKELFAKYKKCTDIYCERYEAGCGIAELAVAV